ARVHYPRSLHDALPTLRDGAAGVMHSLIYFGYLVLFAVTTVLLIDEQLPPSLKFLHGTVYKTYSLVGDVAGIAFLTGLVWAVLRSEGHTSELQSRGDLV